MTSPPTGTDVVFANPIDPRTLPPTKFSFGELNESQQKVVHAAMKNVQGNPKSKESVITALARTTESEKSQKGYWMSIAGKIGGLLALALLANVGLTFWALEATKETTVNDHVLTGTDGAPVQVSNRVDGHGNVITGDSQRRLSDGLDLAHMAPTSAGKVTLLDPDPARRLSSSERRLANFDFSISYCQAKLSLEVRMSAAGPTPGDVDLPSGRTVAVEVGSYVADSAGDGSFELSGLCKEHPCRLEGSPWSAKCPAGLSCEDACEVTVQNLPAARSLENILLRRMRGSMTDERALHRVLSEKRGCSSHDQCDEPNPLCYKDLGAPSGVCGPSAAANMVACRLVALPPENEVFSAVVEALDHAFDALTEHFALQEVKKLLPLGVLAVTFKPEHCQNADALVAEYQAEPALEGFVIQRDFEVELEPEPVLDPSALADDEERSWPPVPDTPEWDELVAEQGEPQPPDGAGRQLWMSGRRRRFLAGLIGFTPPVELSNFNDPLATNQWHLDRHSRTKGSDVVGAWTFAKTKASPYVIGILDNGYEWDHEDLIDNLWVNQGETCENGVDDDLNGYVDDCHGYDFWSNEWDTRQGLGQSHGTVCGAVITAKGNNGVGVVGVAYAGARMMALRTMGYAASKITSSLSEMEGWNYARNMGATITTHSYGSRINPSNPINSEQEYLDRFNRVMFETHGCNDDDRAEAFGRPLGTCLNLVGSGGARASPDRVCSGTKFMGHTLGAPAAWSQWGTQWTSGRVPCVAEDWCNTNGDIRFRCQATCDACGTAEGYRGDGFLVVAAAGNENGAIGPDDTFRPPCSFSNTKDHVLCVAATDETGMVADFSNYGGSVSVAAPGHNIWTAMHDNSYGPILGTSLSTPLVAGIALLMKANAPAATWLDIAAVLKDPSNSEPFCADNPAWTWCFYYAYFRRDGQLWCNHPDFIATMRLMCAATCGHCGGHKESSISSGGILSASKAMAAIMETHGDTGSVASCPPLSAYANLCGPAFGRCNFENNGDHLHCALNWWGYGTCQATMPSAAWHDAEYDAVPLGCLDLGYVFR